MRIRKGPRCVPLAPAADRSFLLKGFAHGEGKNARREDDEKKRNGGVVAGGDGDGGGGAAAEPAVAAAAASVAATSGCQDLDNGAASASAETERLEVVDGVRKRLSVDGYSRKGSGCPIAEPGASPGAISISSIIQAGVKTAKIDLAKIQAVSAESVVTSATPLAKSPSIAMKTIDQPTLLLQSLKRVCSAAESTGLKAKEAVAKIQEQGLPGLIDGGERLIVQVAKSFRSSAAFVEREERGRYFIQDPNAWDNFQTADSLNSGMREEAAVPKTAAAEFETVIEAAKQLQNLQEPIKLEPVREKAGFPNNSGTDRWVLALRGKTSRFRKEPPSTSQKASPSRDQSGPRCNRDDGKGWRCVRLAESGFSLCKYHRDQIRRAEIRRRKARNKSKKQNPARPASPASPVSPLQPAVKPANPTSKEVAMAVSVPEAEKTAIDSDNELPDHKRRRFVKAKSLKSLL